MPQSAFRRLPDVPLQDVIPSTSLELLKAAVESGELGQQSLEVFVRRYYRPLHAYILSITRDPHDAMDLLNGFLVTKVIERRLLQRFDPRRRFRPFLKHALRNYVRDYWRKKRIERKLDRLDDPDGYVEDRIEHVLPQAERTLDMTKLREYIDTALARVNEICTKRKQLSHFKLFLGRYIDYEDRPPSWTELGKPHGLDQKTARSRVEAVRRHFRKAILDILVEETGSSRVALEELSYLVSIAGGDNQHEFE